MTTTGISTERARWQARIARVHDWLAETVGAFRDGEIDWAPDTGIDDARNILWSLAHRERRLVRLLETGAAGDGGNDRPGDVDVGEVLRFLGATRTRLAAWLESAAADALHEPLEDDATVDDHLCEHLLGLTEGVARMRALVQLIDPDRPLPASIASALRV